MTIIANFPITLKLPKVGDSCTVSAMLVDYITDGQTDFFSSRQWLAPKGLSEPTLKLGMEIELENCESLQLILKKNISPLRWENFVKLVVTINNLDDKEIWRHEEEYIAIPKDKVADALQLADTQFSGNCSALLSFERFLIFARHKNPVSYKQKNILIFGCGTGAEALVCL